MKKSALGLLAFLVFLLVACSESRNKPTSNIPNDEAIPIQQTSTLNTSENQSINMIDERLALCNEKPKPREVGDESYPILDKYSKVYRLGQLFTAAPCDKDRLNIVFKSVYKGFGAGYVLGSTVFLSKTPSSSLISTFKQIGYVCSNNVDEIQCDRWKLDKSVTVESLLQLEPYSDFFKGDDCINCG